MSSKIKCLNNWDVESKHVFDVNGITGGNNVPIALIIDSHPADSRFTVFSDQITPTITRHVVKGGSEGPIVMYESLSKDISVPVRKDEQGDLTDRMP